MTRCCILLMALLLPVQRWTAQVSGEVRDRENKPLQGAQITYTNIGQAVAERDGTTHITEGTGRVYKVKTDKKGEFVLIGVDFGVYQVQVKTPDGTTVYSGKKLIGDNTDPNVSNTLKVDLSLVIPGAVAPGAETNLADSKKTREQTALIRQENSNAAKINRLIVQLHGALGVQDWPTATDLLGQLIELDPNRWEFYQNLATIQANLTHYQDAVGSYAKGIDIANKLLPSAADPVQAKDNIAGMMLAEGDAYNRMEKLDEAVALYHTAAGLSSKPGPAHFHACNAFGNHGDTDKAIEECNQAIASDPEQWEFYQLLAGQQSTMGKYDDAQESYEKGIAVARKILAATPDALRAKTGLGQMLNSEGNLLVHVKKYDRAIDAFSQAAEVAAYPAMSYFNLCATLYNVKREQQALEACGRALASDPTLSDAYYVKASILFGQGRLENGKYVVPPGTAESLNKYLEYAPFGEHANTVRGMIDKMNAGIETQYKPGRK